MKRTFLIATFLLTSFAFAFAQKYDIKLNLQPNVRVPLRSTNVITQKITIPGKGVQEVKTTVSTEVAFYVSALKDGNYVINGIVNKREIQSESAGNKMTVSGTDSVENKYNKDLIAMTGKTFVAEITPKFQLVGEVKPLNDNMTKAVATQAFSVLQDFFKSLYPDHEVAKGESWKASDEENGITTTTTLTDINDVSYVMDAKVVLNQNMQGLTLKGEGTQNVEIHKAMGIPLYGLSTVPATGSTSSPMGMISVEVNAINSFELVQ